MRSGTALPSQWVEIDEIIQAYEAARERGNPSVEAFLPGVGHPLHGLVLCELLRIELEWRWQHHEPAYLKDYRDRFPELFADPALLDAVAFEEWRQRCAAGEAVSLVEYRELYGIDPGDWPRLEPHPGPGRGTEVPTPEGGTVLKNGSSAMARAAQLYYEYRYRGTNDAGEGHVARTGNGFPPTEDALDAIREVHAPSPAAVRRADATVAMPEVGDQFAGFDLIDVLGRGAFGRVFLARQGGLASRLVALKVTPTLDGESQTLAQLQHTNIVPIYSVHHVATLQAVCMPYFGATTLADLIGHLHTSSDLPRSGREIVSTVQGRKSTVRPPSSGSGAGELWVGESGPGQLRPISIPSEGQALATTAPLLDQLERLSYVEAILWLTVRLAAGLTHAHERGIFHRDLKPANILLTDEGQPMLLDFNLAEDVKEESAPTRMGGTLPYMSPEQLEAFRGGPRKLDGRSDLYSLGVILFELLCGRHPFPSRKGRLSDLVLELLEDRKQPPPRVRVWNPRVTPAVESIVRRCLEPDPDQRYRSALQLQEDLERHLANLPLRHATEPSLRERLGKWSRRHPRLSSSTSLAAVGGSVVLALSLALWGRGEALARHEAVERLREFEMQKTEVIARLSIRTADRDLLDEGVAAGRALLRELGVEKGSQEIRGARRLTAPEREKLKSGVEELLFLLARAEAMRADTADEKPRNQLLTEALALNRQAFEWDSEGRRTGILERQRKDLERQKAQGKPGSVGEPPPAPATADEAYLAASDLAARGEFRTALPLARKAVQKEPRHFSAWFLLGNCYAGLGQDVRAEDCFSTCIALDPTFHWAYASRGLTRLRLKTYDGARADLDEQIRLEPRRSDAYLNRAVARHHLGDTSGALEDLGTALELGAPQTRVYFMRARLRSLAGDQDGARKDLEEGFRREPTDELSWIARGVARVAHDPRGALTDFETALRINPRSRDAAQNKAHVLAEKLGQTEEAIASLDRVIGRNPDDLPARGGRGVLYARLGKDDEAKADAGECLRRDDSPPTRYQVAGIYALTSQRQPEDRARAFLHLSAALRAGYGLDLLETDGDLDPIREEAEFRKLVGAARALLSRTP